MAAAVAKHVPAGTSDVQVLTGHRLVTLVNVRETDGSDLVVDFHDGTSAAAPKVLTIALGADEAAVVAPAAPLQVLRGLFVNRTGEGEIVVHYR